MTKKDDRPLAERIAEFEKDNPPPYDPAAPKTIVPDETVLNTVRRAYAAYITQISIRERPRCPFTFDELSTEERNGWLAAYAEIAPP